MSELSRTFAIGDIHGAHKALIQCLERASFDPNRDELICLGDVCDGWPEVNRCFDELLKIKNLTYVLGNHDYWAIHWAETGVAEPDWLKQGGDNTVKAYPQGMPLSHLNLLKNSKLYHIDQNRLYVHAGILTTKPLKEQTEEIFLWDRTLARMTLENLQNGLDVKLTDFDEVYIGHTPVHQYQFFQPIQSGGVWMMDTGAGWTGVLSMIDVETKEVFASDPPVEMYPEGSGRP